MSSKTITWNFCIATALSVMISVPTFADQRSDVEARIKPIGQVQIQGDESTKIKTEEAEPAQPAQPAKLSGADIYKKYCVVCHAAGVAGAPKFQDSASWSSRKDKGIDALVESATKGVNAMPPKGTCMTCTKEDLKAAIEYMLPK